MKKNLRDKIKSDLAFVFPGQGSQRVGMLADLSTEYPVIIDTFKTASNVLGYDLWDLTQNGPEERLAETAVTQPLMLVSGVAVWRAWRDQNDWLPSLMAGHSLGEYSALVCSQAIEFEEAVALVKKRGQNMQAAVPQGEGAMLAILGLENEAVDDLCRRVSPEQVFGANYNAPGQVVVGGYKVAVDAVAALARAEGATKVIPVAMSAPSHCPLMQPAVDALQPEIEALSISQPQVPIVANVSAALVNEPEEIRQALLQQICKPVRWCQSIQRMLSQGIQFCFECGPGKVLTGINRRIHRPLAAKPLGLLTDFDKATELLLDQGD